MNIMQPKYYLDKDEDNINGICVDKDKENNMFFFLVVFLLYITIISA